MLIRTAYEPRCALLTSLMAIDQVRVANPDEVARVIHADVRGPGNPTGSMFPRARRRVFRAYES